ncbi:MAG: deoxyguanosinetriphosphate triphosphohydrolase [Armatimonadetes bacterium]|nr:deoxyguanosinetriphosphate triphosphohydrolase [Armatimonadota bacterium]
MTIRERIEAWETQMLSPFAAQAARSLGRERAEEPDPVRTAFQRDRDRVLHSKSFRRLKHKTQVFLDPEEDHYRTRLTHTLEVAQISRTVARALRLNEDLTEAIALAHDLGHPPFGHEGEGAIDAVLQEFVPGERFRHYEQSLRVVDVLEKRGEGLNLTAETRTGILGHSKGRSDLLAVAPPTPQSPPPADGEKGSKVPLEATVVRICDRIAYVNHDIDDAVRAGMLTPESLPRETLELLGRTHGERITRMVTNVIEASENEPFVSMSEPVLGATNRLKDFLFENVYTKRSEAKAELAKAGELLKQLFRLYMAEPERVPKNRATGDMDTATARVAAVCDYLSGMTDRYASEVFLRMFFPKNWVSPGA